MTNTITRMRSHRGRRGEGVWLRRRRSNSSSNMVGVDHHTKAPHQAKAQEEARHHRIRQAERQRAITADRRHVDNTTTTTTTTTLQSKPSSAKCVES